MRTAGLAAALFTVALLCSGGASAQPPSWLAQPPVATTDDYFAVATGESIVRARQSALAEVAQQVAVNLQSRTTQRLQKASGESNNQFVLQVNGQSLPLQFSNAEVIRQYQHQNSPKVSVLVKVPKQQVRNFLIDQLRLANQLQFPETSQPPEQLLWVLRYKGTLKQAAAYKLALQQLDTDVSAFSRINSQLENLLAAEQNLGVRVIASRELQPLANSIAQQLPNAAQADLWLQLEQQTQHRNTGNSFQQRRQLSVSLTSPKSPFREYHGMTLEVIGKGRTSQQAAQNAEQQLIVKLNRPFSDWLFQSN